MFRIDCQRSDFCASEITIAGTRIPAENVAPDARTKVKNRTSRLSLMAVVLISMRTGACKPSSISAPVTPVFTPPSNARTALLDDFENSTPGWTAGAWPYFSDSSATSVSPSQTHVTHGNQSLQLSFNLGSQPKAIFTLDRELALGQSVALALDIYN